MGHGDRISDICYKTLEAAYPVNILSHAHADPNSQHYRKQLSSIVYNTRKTLLCMSQIEYSRCTDLEIFNSMN